MSLCELFECPGLLDVCQKYHYMDVLDPICRSNFEIIEENAWSI